MAIPFITDALILHISYIFVNNATIRLPDRFDTRRHFAYPRAGARVSRVFPPSLSGAVQEMPPVISIRFEMKLSTRYYKTLHAALSAIKPQSTKKLYLHRIPKAISKLHICTTERGHYIGSVASTMLIFCVSKLSADLPNLRPRQPKHNRSKKLLTARLASRSHVLLQSIFDARGLHPFVGRL